MDDGCAARLDAAVIAVDRFVGAYNRIQETSCFLLVGEKFDVLSKRPLDRKSVV